MAEDSDVPVETQVQEDKAAEPHHPLSSDTPAFTEHDQEENTETLEDKATKPEDATDSNQLDLNNEKTDDVDPPLLQSDEPKSKVKPPLIYVAFTYCMHTDNFQISDNRKRWENSDVKVVSYDKKVDDVYYEIEVILFL